MKYWICGILIYLTGFLKAEVQAYFNYASFYSPEKGPYVETYLSIIGNSIHYSKNVNNKFQGAVEIGILFKQDGAIKTARKYKLLSPEINDTIQKINFIDQQRFPLPNGNYIIEISINDESNKVKAFSINQSVQINFPDSVVSISDIELLESFKKSDAQNALSKSGYDVIPYVSNFYPENMNTLPFYAEIYQTKKALGSNETFLLNYYVESFENKIIMSGLSRFSKQTTSNVNIVLYTFDISTLPSGNYNLVVDVTDRNNNKIVAKKAFFQRKANTPCYKLDDLAAINISNTFADKINDRDSLIELIRSLRPISSESEKLFAETQLKNKDNTLMKQYLFNFWMKRNEQNPELAFANYNTEVKKVNRAFGSTIRKGYNTDRGRVYLQYGPPDQRAEASREPSNYPYEIWHYYKAKDQMNKKFIFYNPDLVGNYILLHSDALGETNDPNWQIRLKKRTTQTFNIDQETVGDQYGDNIDENFSNPR